MNMQLAKISSARLEIQERGILGFWIFVDYEEFGSQGVGGIALDEFKKGEDGSPGKRVGTAYGCEVIRRLLLEFCVNDFSEMTGKHIWVLGEGEGLSFKPLGVKALKGDNKKSSPVIFDDILKEFNTIKE